MLELEERKIKERDFHNTHRLVTEDAGVAETRWSPELEGTIQKNPAWANMKYYAIERLSRNFILDWYSKNVKGKVVLDYCCGNGEDGMLIAKAGAQKVIGIDISDVSIENSHNLAVANGVGDIVEHRVADAENTGFPDNTFDIITEYGCLHHLDLSRAIPELARVLKPDGKLIGDEALAHNIIIHTYRKLTPHLRTEWEVDHILRRKDFKLMENYFGKVDLRFYYLFSILAVPFRNTFFFKPLLWVLELLDSIVLKIPGIRWQAWQVVLILSEPKKDKLVKA
ncbi:MAG: class I SAM-dependent methyltransferase [Alphaproteobacteria bacterium]